MQVKGGIKHWLYLLCTPNFLDIDKKNAPKTFKNREILNVLIQQGIMKFKKAKCKVLPLNGAIPSTNKGWMGNRLRADLQRT